MWHDGSLYVSAPPSIWKLTDTDGDGVADERVEWFTGQDPDRLRQRPARPLSRARRLDLLVQGSLRRANLRAAGQAAVRHPGRPYLPLPARRNRHRAGHDRRHGQPRRRRLHARRRADLHHHVLRASRRRPARRPGPRDLRRHLRKGPRPDLPARPSMDGPRSHAAAPAHGPGRSLRAHSLRVRRLRQGLSRTTSSPATSTSTRSAGTSSRRPAPHSRPRTKTSSPARISTSTRPTCSKTPTAAWSSSTPAAGTSSAARPRSFTSPTCWERSIECSAPGVLPAMSDPRGQAIRERN